MPLATRLAFQVDKRVQFKGTGLFSANAVRVISSSESEFHAKVISGRPVEVSMVHETGRLRVSCDCSYFSDRGDCAHLWAAVLEADRRGALAEALKERHLQLDDGLEEAFENALPPLPQLPPPARIPPWQEYLSEIRRGLDTRTPVAAGWPPGFEIQYVLDAPGSLTAAAVVFELYFRSKKKSGEWTDYKELRIAPAQVSSLPDPADTAIVAAMLGGNETYAYYPNYPKPVARKVLPHALALKLLPQIAETGRFAIRSGAGPEAASAVWDAGEPWRLWLDVRQDDRDQWKISGSLRRAQERMDLAEPLVILKDGFVVSRAKVARYEDAGAFPWVLKLRSLKHIPFPDRERDAVMAALLGSSMVPPMDLDEPLRFEERRLPPRLGLRVTNHAGRGPENGYQANLLFDYGRGWIADGPGSHGDWFPEERIYVVRDSAAENASRETLQSLGLRPLDGGWSWRLPVKSMPRAVRELLHAGWHVEAEGKAFRRPGATRAEVRSGVDWFELHGEVDYDGATASLPELLAAMRRGDTMVPLADGTFGVLPEEWLKRFGTLAGLGTGQDDHVRFGRNQAGLLDALLAAQPEVRADETFERVREKLVAFHGVRAAAQPEGFVGQLRDYQREGLGWMEFLRDFGFGGCLADDMGVGKTAQMLAMLESRRAEGHGPSLVVAPRSLMFNWRAEAARFTPKLRVIEHTGLERDIAKIPEHDLVLTTYGTMLRDAPALSEIAFDYIVLDESQAIKNASTASAKAVRLLRGQHRMALTGTPVENHLGELWSLFEFLNPGMLGESKVLKLSGGLSRNPSEDGRRLLGHALRPFILRRTKQQVARELPAKTEQTIFCELEGAQKQRYDELRNHYRDTLLKRVQADGMGRSKMHVLEALLRLRQAACHPGLIDASRKNEPSAKLDALMAQLEELREEGHKALVFSQFTSLLAIVRARLDEQGVKYAYLDGKTKDRQARVEMFQEDPSCGLFLISLKAGGVGLNLTAAEYVFLLDPWWNPAVEAQAVDRTHRIGQTRPVFAYRLIARGTVEEKVLELQKTKRDLADAILGEDNSLVRDLKREDLELLLS